MAVREGAWDCPYCGRQRIRGPLLYCGGCGAARDADVEFYLPDDAAVVEDAAGLAAARSGPDWHCESCGSDNHAGDPFCSQCGGAGSGAVRRGEVLVSSSRDEPAPEPAPELRSMGFKEALLVLLAILVVAGIFDRLGGETFAHSNAFRKTSADLPAWIPTLDSGAPGEVPPGARIVSFERTGQTAWVLGGTEARERSVELARVTSSAQATHSRWVRTKIGSLTRHRTVQRREVVKYVKATRKVEKRVQDGFDSVDERYEAREKVTRTVWDEKQERVRDGYTTRTEKVREGTETKTRTVTEKVQVGTKKVKVGTKDLGNGYFEDVYETVPVYETKTREETYEVPRYKTVTKKVPRYKTVTKKVPRETRTWARVQKTRPKQVPRYKTVLVDEEYEKPVYGMVPRREAYQVPVYAMREQRSPYERRTFERTATTLRYRAPTLRQVPSGEVRVRWIEAKPQ